MAAMSVLVINIIIIITIIISLLCCYQPSKAPTLCFTVSRFSLRARVTTPASPRFVLRMARCFLPTVFLTRFLTSAAAIVDVPAGLGLVLTSSSSLLLSSLLLQVTSRYGRWSLFRVLRSSRSDSSLESIGWSSCDPVSDWSPCGFVDPSSFVDFMFSVLAISFSSTSSVSLHACVPLGPADNKIVMWKWHSRPVCFSI